MKSSRNNKNNKVKKIKFQIKNAGGITLLFENNKSLLNDSLLAGTSCQCGAPLCLPCGGSVCC